ncbi:MAG: DUF4988 domain-containing protein [Rikenellaceae bacterium]|nr:DUF4988 domain-containing protein [Rikenellaceae bacterium]
MINTFMRRAWVVCVAVIVVACTPKYDDSELRKELGELEQRVTAMQTVLDALKNNLFITSVIQTEGGYTISFSNNTTATITNGADGTNGTDGSDGETLIASIVEGVSGVTFTLTNGDSFSIPKGGAPLSIAFEGGDTIRLSSSGTAEVRYAVTSTASTVQVEAIGSGQVEVVVIPDNQSGKSGSIAVARLGTSDVSAHVVVLVSDGNRVIMSRLSFGEAGGEQGDEPGDEPGVGGDDPEPFADQTHYGYDDITGEGDKSDFIKTWDYYGVDSLSGGTQRVYLGQVVISENTADDALGVDYLNISGLSTIPATAGFDDTMPVRWETNKRMFYVDSAGQELGSWNGYNVFAWASTEEGEYLPADNALIGGFVGEGLIAFVSPPAYIPYYMTFTGLEFVGSTTSNPAGYEKIKSFKWLLLADPTVYQQ